jgi:GNAT superfamily N-acetyltransferase
MPDIRLSRLEPDQFDAVNAMILRSKAYWGYGEDMMAKMEAVLRLDPGAAKDGRAVAAWRDDAPIGLAQISTPYELSDGRGVMLDLLFIAPDSIGTGLGKRLYDWALEQARMADVDVMQILSDPNARSFYTAMGASFVEDRPSKLIPGRALPWLEHRLP